MQIKGLHKNIYKAAALSLSTQMNDKLAIERYKILGDWDFLLKKNIKTNEIAAVTGISRSTYYRRKKALKNHGFCGLKARSKRPKKVRTSKIYDRWVAEILRIRQQYPTYGKAKIALILKRDFCFSHSESTVGRVLSKLMKEGKVKKYAPCAKVRKPRRFQKHARPWTSKNTPEKPGEMVQIDHMSVNKNGCPIKHFKAWDPITKRIIAQAYSCATSKTATNFLDKVIKELGFPVVSIQVDGGSEFMKHFEEKCKDLNILLYVLPPRSPKLNGGVERGNRTFREDLYNSHTFIPGSLAEVRAQLEKAVNIYNDFRPHMSLGGLTPNQYAKNIINRGHPVSHHMN